MKHTAQTGVVVLLCLSLLFGGGCTAALWRSVNPEEPIWMPSSQVTEEQLQARHLRYRKTRLMLAEPVDGYLVEKTALQKSCDTVVLVVATPFAVVADGVLILTLDSPDFWTSLADALANH